jgi:hypothetical protein
MVANVDYTDEPKKPTGAPCRICAPLFEDMQNTHKEIRAHDWENHIKKIREIHEEFRLSKRAYVAGTLIVMIVMCIISYLLGGR